jgi:hypothetical protein
MCIPVEENRLFKVVHPFFHIAVSSADYKKDVLYSSKDNPLLPRFEMRFYHSGRELVQIGQERYCYGEALVRMRRFDDTGTSPFLGVSHSVFVIDEKLIPNLLSQPEYKEVFMLLYTLYHISSHDGMMHGVFKDSSKAVQDVLSKDPIGSRFLGAFDGQCLTYEINYLRLTRHMFELCCKWNTTLKKDVESLYEQVCELTKHWPDVLGQYIRFIALNRVSRLIDTKLGKLPPLFVELLARSNGVGKVFVDDWYKMNFLIHTDHQKEALLFDDGPPVSYASMTRTMFDVYRDFYPK